MPQKLNKAGKMQDYIPAGNGDPSGEYGTSKGTNKNFTTADKKKESKANVITENKSVVVGDKKTTYKGDLEQQEKSLKNRIENLEGVIKNIENGDPTGAEDLQDMKRRLKNYKEDYERQFGKDSNRLRKILEERNRNEDIDHAIDTNYFGFGSLDKLEEAHKNNYGKGKANIINDDLTGKSTEKIEKLKNQKDEAEKEMDKYVNYASRSFMPEYQDEAKRKKYYNALEEYNRLRKEINKLEEIEIEKRNKEKRKNAQPQKEQREITSTTYERAKKRMEKDVENFLGIKK